MFGSEIGLLPRAAKAGEVPVATMKRFTAASPMALIHRQDPAMATVMKQRWAEADVAALPVGEHDFFERKSGALMDDSEFRKDLGKALSAFANSGGGHLLLGVRDDGTFDGVNPIKSGRTSTREWLEQVVPNLLVFPLHQFRVHEVEVDGSSSIPAAKVVIVIDVGDSTLAPHQAAESKIYYYRQGGHSVPAPHFYLETLRNRLVGSELTASLAGLELVTAHATKQDAVFFIEARLIFDVINNGRIAAYKWALALNPFGDGKTVFSKWEDFPVRSQGRSTGMELDITILPSLKRSEGRDVGFYLHLDDAFWSATLTDRPQIVTTALSKVLPFVEISYRVVSESSPGVPVRTLLSDALRPELADEIARHLTEARNREVQGTRN